MSGPGIALLSKLDRIKTYCWRLTSYSSFTTKCVHFEFWIDILYTKYATVKAGDNQKVLIWLSYPQKDKPNYYPWSWNLKMPPSEGTDFKMSTSGIVILFVCLETSTLFDYFLPLPMTKAELLQLNRTQFSSLGIFICKKVGNRKN